MLIGFGLGFEFCLQELEAGSCLVDVFVSLEVALFTNDIVTAMIFEQHALGAESLLVCHAVEITKVSGMLYTEIGCLQAIDQLYRRILTQLGIHPCFLLLSDRLYNFAELYVLPDFSHGLVCAAEVSPAHKALD